MTRTAFLDESLRFHGPGLLLLAVVVVEDHDRECRQGIRRLRLPGQRRIHWHDESRARRDRIIDGIASLPWVAAVVASQPVPRRLQNPARAQCLEALVAWLVDERIDRLVIESRGAHSDRQDRQTVIGCRRAGHRLASYSFARAGDEPLLWIADVVAGVASAHLESTSHRWFAGISDSVTMLPRLQPK